MMFARDFEKGHSLNAHRDRATYCRTSSSGRNRRNSSRQTSELDWCISWWKLCILHRMVWSTETMTPSLTRHHRLAERHKSFKSQLFGASVGRTSYGFSLPGSLADIHSKERSLIPMDTAAPNLMRVRRPVTTCELRIWFPL